MGRLNDAGEIKKATKRFHELYWGEMGMVERDNVTSAMIAFRKALDAKKPQDTLRPLALRIASACRDELAGFLGTDAWKH